MSDDRRPADEEVVRLAQAGDLEAFSVLYRRHGEAVWRVAYALTGNRDDAEDARQETFVRAFRALPRFRGASSIRTWLLRVCLNVSRRPQQRASPQTAPNPCVDPAAQALGRLRAEEVRRAIASLPRAAAALVGLCDLEGLSYREAAQVLGCSEKGIGPRLHRARLLLKGKLEAMGTEE